MHSNCLFAPLSPALFALINKSCQIIIVIKRVTNSINVLILEPVVQEHHHVALTNVGNIDDMCYCDCDVPMKV